MGVANIIQHPTRYGKVQGTESLEQRWECVLGNLGLTFWTLAFCQISTATFTWGLADTQQVTRWQIYPISAWLSEVKWWARRLWVWHQHVLVCFGLELVEVLTRSRANVELPSFMLQPFRKTEKGFQQEDAMSMARFKGLPQNIAPGPIHYLIRLQPQPSTTEASVWDILKKNPEAYWVYGGGANNSLGFSANKHDWYFASQAPLASFVSQQPWWGSQGKQGE